MPICLLNVDFKISPKLLTDRITPIAEKVISESQTIFIKGRNILEGVVVLHEVLHEFRRTGKQGVLLKIDFEKLYDKVSWSFIQEVLEKKGFSEAWVKQTMCIVQGGKVCIKINHHKSEAYIFGMDEEEKVRIANMLNCKLGELPMTYLGIPLSDTKLGRGPSMD
jgi:hypothetical protein